MQVVLTKEEAEVLSSLIDSGYNRQLWHPKFDYWVKKIQSRLDIGNHLPVNPQHDIPDLSMMG